MTERERERENIKRQAEANGISEEDQRYVNHCIDMEAAKWCDICGEKWCLAHDPQSPSNIAAVKDAQKRYPQWLPPASDEEDT
jgi:hypothetical protein